MCQKDLKEVNLTSHEGVNYITEGILRGFGGILGDSLSYE